MKLPSILALIVILFLSLSAVSADEAIHDVTNASDSVIDDPIIISDSDSTTAADLSSGFDDSISLELSDELEGDTCSNDSSIASDSIIDSDAKADSAMEDNSPDMDDEIASNDFKDSKKLESALISDSEIIEIDNSNYSKYFDATNGGLIKPGTLKSGDSIKLKSMSDKVFTINVPLNIFSDDGDQLSNCLIRLIEGSSGTIISNVRIVNTKEKASRSNYYLSGISIIDSANNIIANSTINVSVHKCFAIMMSNASYNKIINNTLISGLSSTIPTTASSYNEIRGNHIESELANMVYQSAYGNGDFMPIDDEVCSGNIIANNYLKSRTVPTIPIVMQSI